MSNEHQDFSQIPDEELKRLFLELTEERGKRMEIAKREIENTIARILEIYPELTERDIILGALDQFKASSKQSVEPSQESKESRVGHTGPQIDININNISSNGDIYGGSGGKSHPNLDSLEPGENDS